jgi:hypothetical protein
MFLYVETKRTLNKIQKKCKYIIEKIQENDKIVNSLVGNGDIMLFFLDLNPDGTSPPEIPSQTFSFLDEARSPRFLAGFILIPTGQARRRLIDQGYFSRSSSVGLARRGLSLPLRLFSLAHPPAGLPRRG